MPITMYEYVSRSRRKIQSKAPNTRISVPANASACRIDRALAMIRSRNGVSSASSAIVGRLSGTSGC